MDKDNKYNVHCNSLENNLTIRLIVSNVMQKKKIIVVNYYSL